MLSESHSRIGKDFYTQTTHSGPAPPRAKRACAVFPAEIVTHVVRDVVRLSGFLVGSNAFNPSLIAGVTPRFNKTPEELLDRLRGLAVGALTASPAKPKLLTNLHPCFEPRQQGGSTALLIDSNWVRAARCRKTGWTDTGAAFASSAFRQISC